MRLGIAQELGQLENSEDFAGEDLQHGYFAAQEGEDLQHGHFAAQDVRKQKMKDYIFNHPKVNEISNCCILPHLGGVGASECLLTPFNG